MKTTLTALFVALFAIVTGCGGNVNTNIGNGDQSAGGSQTSAGHDPEPTDEPATLNPNPNKPGNTNTRPACWTRGKAGSATSIRVLSQNAGRLNSLGNLQALLELVGPQGPFQSNIASPTAPEFDFGGFMTTFKRLFVHVPPYVGTNGTDFYPSLLVIAEPGKDPLTVTHFATHDEAEAAFNLHLWQNRTSSVNALSVYDFAGLDISFVDCRAHYYVAGNGNGKVHELFADGTSQIVTELNAPVSSLACESSGNLLAATLPLLSTECEDPTPCRITGVARPASVVRIMVGGMLEPVATMPNALTLTKNYIQFLKEEPVAVVPHGLRVAVATGPGGLILVADQIAMTNYTLDLNGMIVRTESMEAFTTSLTTAPNGVIYALEGAVLDEAAAATVMPARLKAYDSTWRTLTDLTGQAEALWGDMNGFPVACSAGICRLPFGAYTSLGADWCNTLYLSDSVTGQILAVTLSFD